MGTKRLQGIIARPSSILIDLRGHGYKQERLTLDGEPIAPTPANLKFAEQQRRLIIAAIDAGDFRIKDFFPDSPNAEKDDSIPSFEDVVEEWLAIKAPELAVTTLGEYRNALKHSFGVWWKKPARELTYRVVQKRISTIKFGTIKTRNNVINILKGVLGYGVKAKIITDPTVLLDLENVKRKNKPKPDPFTPDQVEKILADMLSHYGDEAFTYYEAAFFGGFRPSEQIALLWPKVDLDSGTVRVDAARVRWNDKDTKTHEDRDVELVQRARAGFTRQRKRTQLLESGHVFINPKTGKRFGDTQEPVECWWKPALKRTGIRYRDARQARHTCATMMLMRGCNPAWAAAQLGHALETFTRVYAVWINDADKGRERDKFDAAETAHAMKRKNEG